VISDLFDDAPTALLSGATFSADSKYRYRLWRDVRPDAVGSVTFVMLNPSTADAQKNDPTIRKCIGFVKQWGYRRLEVVNLFAWRATDPKELPKVAEPIGQENDRAILDTCLTSEWVIAAWGSNKFAQRRAGDVTWMLTKHGIHLRCLRRSVQGNPWHPLYVPYGMPISFGEGR